MGTYMDNPMGEAEEAGYAYKPYDYNNYMNVSVQDIPKKEPEAIGSEREGYFRRLSKSMRERLDGIFNTFGEFRVNLDIAMSEEWHLGLTRGQRFACFLGFGVLGIFLQMIAFLRILGAVINPGKFVVPFSLGTGSLVFCLGFLIGWRTYIKLLGSPERRWLGLGLVVSFLITIYSAKKGSRILTGVGGCIEAFLVFAYLISFIPGGRYAYMGATAFGGSSFYSRFMG